MFKTIATVTLLAATVGATSLSATGTAEAYNGRNAAFAAGAALGVLGGAALAAPAYGYGYGYRPAYYAPAPYYGPAPVYYGPACYWTRQVWFDGWGYRHVRRVRVCN